MADSHDWTEGVLQRRTLLGGLAATATAGLAGCTEMAGLVEDGTGDESDADGDQERTSPDTDPAGGAQSADGPGDEARIWPVATDASDGVCRNSSGDTRSATGSGSASYFSYGGCGSWKAFPAVPGETYWILARTDAGVLTDTAFEIAERVEGAWETQRTVEGTEGAHKEHMTKFVPETDRFRIVNVGSGFYVQVYGPVTE